MSNSNDDNAMNFPFQFRATEYNSSGLSHDTKITVFDGVDNIITEDYGEVRLTLPKGIYIVRLERAGEMSEQIIRHSEQTEKAAIEPKRYSAMPSFDTETTHEYYAYTSKEWSKKETSAPIGDAVHTNSRLLVFIRATDKDHYDGKFLADGFWLRDVKSQESIRLERSNVEWDQEHGWIAFSAPIAAGTYLIRHQSEINREMPICIYQGWDSQLFLTYLGRPLFETATIMMSYGGSGYNPDNRVTQAADAAIAGLQNNSDFMPKGAMQMLLHGKFEDPMLGLLGAHILLKRKEVNENTISIVLDNLERLLPESPDVRALELIARQRLSNLAAVEPFDRPPMLRAGLEAVIKASANNPELVTPGSLIDIISPYLLTDSPWSSWEWRGQTFREPHTGALLPARNRYHEFNGGRETADSDIWLMRYLETVRNEQNSKIKSKDLQEISRNMHVPYATVKRFWKTLEKPGPEIFHYT